jgi:hypothetical protein
VDQPTLPRAEHQVLQGRNRKQFVFGVHQDQSSF